LSPCKDTCVEDFAHGRLSRRRLEGCPLSLSSRLHLALVKMSEEDCRQRVLGNDAWCDSLKRVFDRQCGEEVPQSIVDVG
jgi:hypothetical protein